MALTVGDRLGQYDVTALIGEGGMVQVYRATDAQLHRDVALKTLPDAFAADPDRLARFQREAQVPASLNHPQTERYRAGPANIEVREDGNCWSFWVVSAGSWAVTSSVQSATRIVNLTEPWRILGPPGHERQATCICEGETDGFETT